MNNPILYPDPYGDIVKYDNWRTHLKVLLATLTDKDLKETIKKQQTDVRTVKTLTGTVDIDVIYKYAFST